MTVQSVAATIARRICEQENVGYSQPERRSWYANADWAGRVSSPQNADCSSLVCGAICYGIHDTYGVPWGHQALLEINDHWTGNMRGGMELRGFSEVPWNDADLTPAGGFRVGDVILSAANEGGVGHVCIAVEDGGTRSSRRRGSLRTARSTATPATPRARRPAPSATPPTRTPATGRGRPATGSATRSSCPSGRRSPRSRAGRSSRPRPPRQHDRPPHRRPRSTLTESTSPATRPA